MTNLFERVWALPPEQKRELGAALADVHGYDYQPGRAPMTQYAVTFGQKYAREEHPTFPAANPDGYLLVEAVDEAEARELIYQVLGRNWAFMYDTTDPEWDYNPSTYDSHYPRGALGKIEGGTVVDLAPVAWCRCAEDGAAPEFFEPSEPARLDEEMSAPEEARQ